MTSCACGVKFIPPPRFFCRYEAYDHGKDERLNLYLWASKHGSKGAKECAPRFLGCQDCAPVPLTEDWCRINLQLYKPYVGLHAVSEGFASFVAEFEDFMKSDPLCPRQICASLRIQSSRCPVNVEVHEGAAFGQFAASATSDTSMNSANKEAIDAAHAVGAGDDTEEDSLAALELSATELRGFNLGVDKKDWSEGYKLEGETFLTQQATAYYSSQKAAGHTEPMRMQGSASPEHAKGFSQMLLVALSLHVLKAELVADPGKSRERFNLFVQGNPGSGKTFTMQMILNAYRKVHKKMSVICSLAPTGMAASLTGGTTTSRFCKLPIGPKAFAVPYDMSVSGVDAHTAYRKKCSDLVAALFDEGSMYGRPDLAWINHRFCEGRREGDGDGEMFGGVPLRAILQDVMQLPAVCKKGLSNTEPATTTPSACAIGKAVFDDYLRPPFDSKDVAGSIIMDGIFRQKDPHFMKLLQCMRDGTMGDGEVALLDQRRWSKLSAKEKEAFWDEAVFLFPDWRRCKPTLIEYLKRINGTLVVAEGEASLSHASHAGQFSLPMKNVLMEGAAGQVRNPACHYTGRCDFRRGSECILKVFTRLSIIIPRSVFLAG